MNDPYDIVEARGYFVICCRECDRATGPLPIPFATPDERGAWAAAHRSGTGHDRWFVLDPQSGISA